MEQFLGLSRDASREKAETGTSPFNRNIVYNKQLGSISQENGFEFNHYIEGLIIGMCSTNKHIVYISVNEETNNTIISYMVTHTEEVIKVIDTNKFNYSIQRPVEMVATYNYKNELIIIFSDNVFKDSSAPRLINLTNIGLTVTNGEFLNQNEADLTLLFTNINQPIYNIKYGEGSNHTCDVVFFTIAYILPDGVTRTRFIPVLAEAFPVYGFSLENKREITFKIDNLSPIFKQFIVGIVAYKDGGLFGYESQIINYSTSSYEYVFSSLDNLTLSSPEAIIVETSTFDRVKTLTIGNDTVLFGGVQKDNTNKYQKYANNLKLNLFFDLRSGKSNRHQAPLLCPDEVYYFTIALKKPDGTYSEEFHIPNRDSEPSDLVLIDKTALGLNNLTEEDIPSFRLINSGKWVDSSEGLPNFNSLTECKLDFGYWENTEKYPNVDDYNGTIDYDGITTITNGRDLRNKTVKLHRIPGLDALSQKFPMRLGMDFRNQDPIVNDKDNRNPAFSLSMENFTEVFSIPIANGEIDGYRLSFVKKDGSSKIVADNAFIKPLVIEEYSTFRKSNIFRDFPDSRHVKYTQFGFTRVRSINLSVNKGSTSAKVAKANFGFFESPLTSDNGTSSTINQYELGYKDMTDISSTTGSVGQYAQINNNNDFYLRNSSFKIPNINQQYASIVSIEQTPGNVRSKKNLYIHEQIKMKALNENTVLPLTPFVDPDSFLDYGWNIIGYTPTSLSDSTSGCVLPFYNHVTNAYENKTIQAQYVQQLTVNVTLLTLRKDVHQGLNPTEFVTIGAADINNSTRLFKDFGDTFINNVYDEIFEQFGDDFVVYFQQVFSGMLSIHNNTMVSFKKDKILGKKKLITDTIDELMAYDYQKIIYTKESTRQLNTLIANTSFNYRTPFNEIFPYRVNKALNLPSESLSTLNARSFLANSYYDLPNTRGIIISLTGFDKGVYCQQRYSLSIFQIKEKLSNNDDNTAYLAEADIFAYKPHVIIDEDNKGYVGCVHQFSRKLTKEGYLVIDAERGRITLLGQGPKEISKIKMENEFNNILTPMTNKIVPTLFDENAVEDNPFNGNGIITGFDDETNRILLTVNNYDQIELPEGYEYINGIPYFENKPVDIKNPLVSVDRTRTFSYNLDWERWISEHDYAPQYYVNTNKYNFAGINVYKSDEVLNSGKGQVYLTNKVNQQAGRYFYFTDPTIYQSYTDLLFNSRYDLSKWYKSINWRTTVKDSNGDNNFLKTIDALMLYTDYQCSGIIELDTENFNLIRNGEGLWTINQFRDMVVKGDELPIDERGCVELNKLHINRIWFEKSDFISNFIVVRLIMYNVENTQIHIHNVNVEARISERN